MPVVWWICHIHIMFCCCALYMPIHSDGVMPLTLGMHDDTCVLTGCMCVDGGMVLFLVRAVRGHSHATKDSQGAQQPRIHRGWIAAPHWLLLANMRWHIIAEIFVVLCVLKCLTLLSGVQLTCLQSSTLPATRLHDCQPQGICQACLACLAACHLSHQFCCLHIM